METTSILIFALVIALGILLINFKIMRDKQQEIQNLNELQNTYINAISTLVTLKDSNLRFIFVNQSFMDCWKMSEQEIIGSTDYDFMPQKNAEIGRTSDLAALTSKKVFVSEEIWGKTKWQTTKFPVKLLNGKYGVGAYIRDITEECDNKIENEKSLFRNSIIFEVMNRTNESSFEQLDYVLNESLTLTESKLGLIYLYNEQSQELELNSWSKDVMHECNVIDKHTKHQLEHTGIWGEAVRQRKPIIINDFKHPNPLKKGYPEGHVILTNFISIPVFIENNIVAVVGLANKNGSYSDNDVYQMTALMNGVWNAIERKAGLKQLELEKNKYEYLSLHDPLTNLYNRRFFESEMIRLDTPDNYPLTIMIADLNGLKLTNDAFGHSAGDDLLIRAAYLMNDHCRSEDIIARWGGDEFAILMPNTESEEAKEIVDRINFDANNIDITKIAISIAFGWDTKTNAQQELSTVFKNAEDYMYKKKISESQGLRGTTIKTIINTLFEKSPREKNHSERVQYLATQIAKELNLTQHEINEISTLGLLHDIGKTIVSNNILDKPGKMSEQEWKEMKKHPEIGYRILSGSNEFANLAVGVLSHHEHWDGSGYPKGTQGENIPINARIIAIADAYDAMTIDRPYRKALDNKEAAQEIMLYAGKQFDPDIARVFVEKVLKM